MNTSIGIYLIIGAIFAALVWFERNRSDVPHPYASAVVAFLFWPIYVGIIAGIYVKSWVYRKKDGQPK
jgi:hypothetical protein